MSQLTISAATAVVATAAKANRPQQQERGGSAVGTAFEDEARARGFRFVAGLDEVGRGALAGPVVAAAVILNPEAALPSNLNDSKKLSRSERERISCELQDSVVAFAIGAVSPEEIDRINILQATRQAMLIALRELSQPADYLLIDALELKDAGLPQRAIIGGDGISASIAAASIIAKTYRDALMRDYEHVYPQYDFARHVGYGTPHHLAALRSHGATPIHRRSFRGVL